MTIHERCPAKINLGLRILRKRPDGFHDLLSLFQTISLYDELTLSPAERTSLTVNGMDLPSGDDNLVIRAHRSFEVHFGKNTAVSFDLLKRIPIGAGLGGGSSDAAGALRALDRLHGTAGDRKVMMRAAGELGSDVPFALRGGTAVVTGRGETLTTVTWPFDFTYVIVHPGFGVSTARAYAHCVPRESGMDVYEEMMGRLLDGRPVNADEFCAALVNDFEPQVFGEHPALETLKRRLLEYGAETAFMTGSGSAVVGVFTSAGAAEQCSADLRGIHPTVHVARAVDSD